MLYLVFLFILLAIFTVSLNNILKKALLPIIDECARAKADYESALLENEKLKSENLSLEKMAEETIKLYDLTQDICKTLEEEKIFSIFLDYLKREIETTDCKFIRTKADLHEYQDYTILPLKIDRNNLGYLVAKDIRAADTEKFYILAQQFLLGAKRSILYQKVQELTITDSLTQAFSRRYFFERFNEEKERAERFKQEFSFLMVDIDHFKEFNDHYGHLVGDAILREVSKTIKENIRQVDFMGRYGGEELSIVLTDTPGEQALFAAERIRQAIESKVIKVYDENLKVTISIGVANFSSDIPDVKTIVERADKALYTAKETGRNKVCVYS